MVHQLEATDDVSFENEGLRDKVGILVNKAMSKSATLEVGESITGRKLQRRHSTKEDVETPMSNVGIFSKSESMMGIDEETPAKSNALSPAAQKWSRFWHNLIS